jgi:dienelactone hydrolase
MPDWSVAITIDAPTALADQAVQIRLDGVPQGKKVTLVATAIDYLGATWRSQVEAGGGSIADSMSLLSSMVPEDGRDPDEAFFAPLYPDLLPSFPVTLTAYDGKRQVGRTTIHRLWTADGVTQQTFTLESDHFIGELYAPAQPTAHVAVLFIGGSGGGFSGKFEAALLASHGIPAMAFAYFNQPGLPATLADIPLEYFETAMAKLHAVTKLPIVAFGYSRGAEAALLVTHTFRDQIAAAVVYSPTDRINGSYPPGGDAWTWAGKPVFAGGHLDIDRPTLVIAGGQDRLWPSEASARTLSARGAQIKIYPAAGHLVGTYPYQPTGISEAHPVTHALMSFGGSRAADEAARRDSWPLVLGFLQQQA